jgi:hypothetical protein
MLGRSKIMGSGYTVTGETEVEGVSSFAAREGLMLAAESTADRETLTEVTSPMQIRIPGTQKFKTKIFASMK